MNLIYDNIVYDLQKIGGISSYWYELTKRFLKNEAVKLTFFETSVESENILRQQLKLNKNNLIIKNRGSMFIERFMRLELPTSDCAIFHSSYFRVPSKGSKIVKICTVHDFTHDLYFKGPRVWLHNASKKRAINESDAIITVSENTKNDLLRFYPHIKESKVHVIYNGVSDKFKILDVKLSNNAPSLLYVGARDNYKNFKFVVDILKQLTEYHLNIVGSELSPFELNLLNAGATGRYTVFSHISTDKLNRLYNESTCLFYPSSYEGFGIPLLEAMRAGCPFIALNGSSIPEVAGNAGILMSSLDIKEAVDAVLHVTKFREIYADKGLSQSLKFSWDKCYNETYKLYQSLV